MITCSQDDWAAFDTIKTEKEKLSMTHQNLLLGKFCKLLLFGMYVWVIDQARGQDDWILAKFFFCEFMDRDEVEVHKLAKKERGQYPAILTEQTWSIKDLLYGLW